MGKAWMLAPLLLVMSAGASTGPTTSTGDVDVYHDRLVQVCPDVVTSWTVTLTLGSPSDGDTVLLTVAGGGAEAATWLRPTVSVYVPRGGGCPPATTVAGIVVDGELPYDITWRMGGGPPL